MDRRLIGGLALVVAVIAALAGSARTKHVDGQPVRGTVAGAPQVGECLLEPASSYSGTFDGDIAASDDGAIYPSRPFGLCPSLRYGEVAAVIPDGLDYSQPAGLETLTDPAGPQGRCWPAVEDYVGGAPIYGSERWEPPQLVTLAMVGPTDIQERDGQRWLACVVVGVGSGDEGTTAFSGTVHEMRPDGPYPAELAQCTDKLPDPTGAGGASMNCADPHQAELLGFASSDELDAAVQRKLRAECPDHVRRLTGIADPGADPRVKVSVSSVQLPPDPADPDAAGPVEYYCGVEAVGDHVLTGPLLALGERRLPIR